MKDYLLIIREPDGRTEPTPEEFTPKKHQEHWKQWITDLVSKGQFMGGKPLTLNGAQIAANGTVVPGIHKNGMEIVGGFMLIKAADMDEAISIARTCPSLEADGPVEVRELM